MLLCIARDPDIRMRDVALRVGITERAAFGLVVDLVDGGVIVRTGATNAEFIECKEEG